MPLYIHCLSLSTSYPALRIGDNQILLSPGQRIELLEEIRGDLAAFLREIEPELTPQSLDSLGVRGVRGAAVVQTIKSVYGITEG